VEFGVINGLFTLALLLAFLGLVAWAWSRRRAREFDAAARLPLEPVAPAPPAAATAERGPDDNRNDNEGSP
jgi:cytochrome c oxidase cbb3-type subunit 4